MLQEASPMNTDALGVANRDLMRRERTMLSDALVAQRMYRQLARDPNEASAAVVFGLLARETRENCELLQSIVNGTLDQLATRPLTATPSPRVRCLDIQELARNSRTRAEQLRDLACAERGCGRVLLGGIFDALARDSDKHGSLLLELARYLSTPDPL